MKNKKQKLIALALAGLSALSIASLSAPLIASAEETQYSNILTDLSVDSAFSVDDYPLIADNYSINVIQVAESVDNELFIYAYQPSASLEHKATSVNISTELESVNYINYDLTFLNSEGALFKYKVEDLTFSTLPYRVYEISSIYRAFDGSIDEELENGNTVNYVSYSVGKSWSVQDINNERYYSCIDVELIEITDKFIGFVRYESTGAWVNNYCDRHFIVFNTDKQIDRLIEADIFYKTQTIHCNYLDNSSLWANNPLTTDFGEIEENYSHLSIYDDQVEFTVSSGGFLGLIKRELTYSWDGIQTVSEFIDSVNVEKIYSSSIFDTHVQSEISEENLAFLQDKQWALTFDATDYTHNVHGTGGGGHIYYTLVSEVSILRLTFETDGKVYNLGVVDTMQTGSNVPINTTSKWNSIPWWVWLIVAVLVLVALAIMFPEFIMAIIKVPFKIFEYIFKGIWWLITAPFSLLKK